MMQFFKINNTWTIATLFTLAGLLLGYLIFNNPDETRHEKTEQSSGGEEVIYTCSMHPQIRQSEPGLCPICEMELIPAGSGNEENKLIFKMTEEAKKLAQIETVLVAESDELKRVVQLNGVVELDERRVYSQVGHIPGRVEELNVQFVGEKVRKGQILGKVYSPELVQAQRELLEVKKLENDYPELLEAARQKLLNWKITEDQISGIESTGEIIEDFPLQADHSGVVGERFVANGDYIKSGETLFEIVNLDRVWILFDAYEKDLSLIQVGDRIEFTTPAIPDKTFSGKVEFIDPLLNGDKRVTHIRVSQSNTSFMLKPGMFVRGKLESFVNVGSTPITIPRSAVLWTGKRSVVWIEVPGTESPVYEYREVILGPVAGDQYEVASGLNRGDRVVVRGAFTLDAAAQLNNQSSMINGLLLNEGNGQDTSEIFADVPEELKRNINQCIAAYIELKDALVAGNIVLARQAAEKLNEQIYQISFENLSGKALSFIQGEVESMKSGLKTMLAADELEKIREEFSGISDGLIVLGKRMGVSGDRWYVQHCPMAFDNTGANWISEESAIRNPYFGDKMLKCGVVTSEIE